jgi:hypothetical protein
MADTLLESEGIHDCVGVVNALIDLLIQLEINALIAAVTGIAIAAKSWDERCATENPLTVIVIRSSANLWQFITGYKFCAYINQTWTRKPLPTAAASHHPLKDHPYRH